VVHVSLQLEHEPLIPNDLALLLEPKGQFDTRPVVSYLIRWAKVRGASDLHLSPLPDRVEVGIRVDGVLRHQFDLERADHERLTVGLKNSAKLVSYKRSTPQDGALQVEGMDVRIATVPTVHGERIVARLLHPVTEPKNLHSLGFTPEELKSLEYLIDRPQGLFLATGPAGSGKTTTLISLMIRLVELRRQRLSNDNSYRCSVVTLEDPVEYVVAEFHQTSIKQKIGMTFTEGLRSVLRQDPELILVGEIRDRETALAVVQAGLSGHVVFSSLHANDAVGVIPRLLELGVEPYQLGAALSGVICQRLLRILCPNCKNDDGSSPQPVGCPDCLQSGYMGRMAVPELLTIDEDFRDMILRRAPLREMREQAGRSGTIFLWESAMARVNKGLTTEAEVRRVISS
jgi:type II secretory ATPase GspE/PulE/Tfp pilus assembly ATPase PilB-like protein